MMIIGKYTVYDWVLPPFSAWVRTFYYGDVRIGAISIGVIPGNPDTTYLLFSFLPTIRKSYLDMFGSDEAKVFHSIDEAKEHVDIFLDKLQKLKAFI